MSYEIESMIPAEPGWRVAWMSDYSNCLEVRPVIAWALVKNGRERTVEALFVRHPTGFVVPVHGELIDHDYNWDDDEGVTESEYFVRVLAPGEELPTIHEVAEHFENQHEISIPLRIKTRAERKAKAS